MTDHEPWYISLTDVSGDTYVIAVGEGDKLDAAYGAYIESGRTRDKLIELDMKSGAPFKTALSNIMSWVVVTHASYEAHARHNRDCRAIQKQVDPEYDA